MQGLAINFPRKQLRLPYREKLQALGGLRSCWAGSLVWQNDKHLFRMLRSLYGMMLLHYMRPVSKPYWRYTWPRKHMKEEWFVRRDRTKPHGKTNRLRYSEVKDDEGTEMLDVGNKQFVDFACGIIGSLCRDYSGLALDNGLYLDRARAARKRGLYPRWEYADKTSKWNQSMAEFAAALQEALKPKPVIVNVTADPAIATDRKWLRMLAPNVGGMMFESPSTTRSAMKFYEWALNYDGGRIVWWTLGDTNTIEDVKKYNQLYRRNYSYISVPDEVLEVLR